MRVKGLRRRRIQRGDTALVVGLGVMGDNPSACPEGAEGQAGSLRPTAVPYRLQKASDSVADAVIDVNTMGLKDGLQNLPMVRWQTCRGRPNSANVMTPGTGMLCGPVARPLFFTPAKPAEKADELDPNYHLFQGHQYRHELFLRPNDTAEARKLMGKKVVSAERWSPTLPHRKD